MNRLNRSMLSAGLWVLLLVDQAWAGVGDGQLATDHPWYPGELACSTFERLAKTQAALYQRVTGITPSTDQERALASWLWRNTHYWHGEAGVEDLWNRGFANDTDSATREYWTGLFAHGFGLCGTTHAQWTAEMEYLLGHNRARVAGVTGHNSFEVFLKGGPYKTGRWALLDHDVSTVVFDDAGSRLLAINEIQNDVSRWTRENTTAAKQQGWPVCGLHPDDGSAFRQFNSAEYLAGYAGPPPIVYLRRGESLRRYYEPGLDDGQTFVYWGLNYRSGGVPGPERSRTWVNQPERMYRSTEGAGFKIGQARFANAVYTYRPDFRTTDYCEAVIDESDQHVTFEFQTPYIIAATPASDEPWGIYQPGCENGLVITSAQQVRVSITVDRGGTWQDAGLVEDKLDLTDHAKGHRQYWIRFEKGAQQLADAQIQIKTICQANASIMPRLVDARTTVRFQSSARAVVSAGPNITQAASHIVEGAFGSPNVTLELVAPRGAKVTDVFAAAHIASSNPPSPDVTYKMDISLDQGSTWQSLLNDWRITRDGDQPSDFWSQSLCWSQTKVDERSSPVRIRFYNDGGKVVRRAEMHLVYRVPNQDSTRVTFHWRDKSGEHTQSHDFRPTSIGRADDHWELATGQDVKSLWVETEPVY